MVWILLEWNIYAFYTNKDTVLLAHLQASWLLFVELLTGDLAYSMLHNGME